MSTPLRALYFYAGSRSLLENETGPQRIDRAGNPPAHLTLFR